MTNAENDEMDDLLGSEEPREALRRKMRSEGAQAAYKALLEVCQDPKAPAPARATSGVALLRAGGFLGKSADSDELDEKPLEQMTAAELERTKRRLLAKQRRLEREIKDETSAKVVDVFG